jgi:two-component system, OmpR family, sensor kinase
MSSLAGVQTTAGSFPVLPQVALQMIAHELRQPLSAIESIAYYLGLVLPPGDDRAREHVARLQQLVEQSNWILTCGLQLADQTPLAPVPLDLQQLIRQAIATRTSQGHPQPDLELSGDVRIVRLDPPRGRALIENLLAMFIHVAGDAHPVRLRTAAPDTGEAGGVVLEISTAAPGYRSEAALGAGSALGLECARRIVHAHGGSLTVDVAPVSGIRLRAVLP